MNALFSLCCFLQIIPLVFMNKNIRAELPEEMRYVRIHWLSNMGKIFSNSYDTVLLSATSTIPQGHLVCGNGGQNPVDGRSAGITFTNGQIYKFDDLLIPVAQSDYLMVTLGVNLQSITDNNGGYFTMQIDNITEYGFYAGVISMEEYEQGRSIYLKFYGLQFEYEQEGYTQESAYHLLVQLLDIPSYCASYVYEASECYVFEKNIIVPLIMLLMAFITVL